MYTHMIYVYTGGGEDDHDDDHHVDRTMGKTGDKGDKANDMH